MVCRSFCASSRSSRLEAYPGWLQCAHCTPCSAAPSRIRVGRMRLPIETNRCGEGEERCGQRNKDVLDTEVQTFCPPAFPVAILARAHFGSGHQAHHTQLRHKSDGFQFSPFGCPSRGLLEFVLQVQRRCSHSAKEILTFCQAIIEARRGQVLVPRGKIIHGLDTSQMGSSLVRSGVVRVGFLSLSIRWKGGARIQQNAMSM